MTDPGWPDNRGDAPSSRRRLVAGDFLLVAPGVAHSVADAAGAVSQRPRAARRRGGASARQPDAGVLLIRGSQVGEALLRLADILVIPGGLLGKMV
jgi:hypothetical protein